jgi:hypothetical protein
VAPPKRYRTHSRSSTPTGSAASSRSSHSPSGIRGLVIGGASSSDSGQRGSSKGRSRSGSAPPNLIALSIGATQAAAGTPHSPLTSPKLNIALRPMHAANHSSSSSSNTTNSLLKVVVRKRPISGNFID